MTSMTSVTITDLRANLSRYLHAAREGSEIEVCKSGVPLARLTPPKASNRKSRKNSEPREVGGSARAREHERVRNLLIEQGVLRPGNGRAHDILRKPLIRLSSSLVETVREEREDRV